MDAPVITPFEQLLLSRAIVDDPTMERARLAASRTGRTLLRVLVDDGLAVEDGVMRALADHLALTFVDLVEARIDPLAMSVVPEPVARRLFAIGIGYDDDDAGTLVVATADPLNPFVTDDVQTVTGRPVRAVVATRAGILQVLSRLQTMDVETEEAAALAIEDHLGLEAESEDEDLQDAPIVRLLNLIITQAVDRRASDVHLEPLETAMRVRYRIDGVLHEQMQVPKELHPALVSRLKIMGEMDIAERRVPQDGRVGLVIGGRAVDLRVATLPTVHGEKAVIRILDKGRGVFELSELGFTPRSLDLWKRSFSKPHGMTLVTGPTGSGKSTTLYATLQILNGVGRNILTVEDPVEYRLHGVNQIQVNPKAGLTFASSLRSFLRADPDIILVGEIRDAETARIAIQASLTGHLVLSTLHTNDAPSAPTRLIDMGVEPFLVSSAIECVLAQRLVRLLCDRCKDPFEADEPTAERLGCAQGALLFRSRGCQACTETGYRGRQAVIEVMPMSEEIRRLAAARSPTDRIAEAAREAGMVTLEQDAIRVVLEGRTSTDELARVIA